MFLKRKNILITSLILFSFAFIIFKNNQRKTPSFLNPPQNIKAAIIPHHLLAQSLIEDLGKRAVLNKKIKKILIVGPNHEEKGKGPIITNSNYLKNSHLVQDQATLLKDHSCWAPKSVLEKYFNNVEISCLLLSYQADLQTLQEIAQELSQKHEEVLLVISVDFSHYLNQDQANKNDLITQDLIINKDLNSLLKLNNAYLDSPKSLAFLFFYLKKIPYSNEKIINHLNSAQILKDPNLTSTTSYFEIIYW